MKLIMAIIQDHIVQDVLNELSENKVRATKLSSTGGFFKKGNTTVLIGIEDEKVDRVMLMVAFDGEGIKLFDLKKDKRIKRV